MTQFRRRKTGSANQRGKVFPVGGGSYRKRINGVEITRIGTSEDNESKLVFYKPCDRLRQTVEGERFWQSMMKNRVEVTKDSFLDSVDVSRVLDEDETFNDYINYHPDIKFFRSNVDGERVRFFQTLGFEFIFKSV